MRNHGTACTIGQSGEIGGNIIRALPNALKLLEEQGIIPAKNIVKYTQEGERLSCAIAAMFKLMYNGHADIAAMLEGFYIDSDTEPRLLPGSTWTVCEHRSGGRLKWNPLHQADALHLSEDQKKGVRVDGLKLYKELARKRVLNASVLDHLLVNQNLIPDEWKGKIVFFWGTIYRAGDCLYVRYLHWDSEYNTWRDRPLAFNAVVIPEGCFAALRAD